MPEFKRPYHKVLYESFLAGKTVAEAAREAGCSWPTAQKYRKEQAEQIAKEQSKSVAGVLESLKKLLPTAVERLDILMRAPAPPPPCDCQTRPHTPTCSVVLATLQQGSRTSNADDIRTIRTVFASFEIMREVDFEARLRAVEKKLAEQAPPPQDGKEATK